jgi:hypothetical protein
MKAERQVFVKGADFSGTAEVVTYNEAKTQIIFQGGPNGRAKLYKFKAQPGLPPDVIDAGKILYNITTGEHSTSETRGIQSGN